MMLLFRLLTVALTLLVAAELIPGIEITSFYSALLVAVVLGLLNITVRPLLLLFSLPITLITFGLFVFVINAAIIMLVGMIVTDFVVTGFVPALVLSLFLTVVNWFAHRILE